MRGHRCCGFSNFMSNSHSKCPLAVDVQLDIDVTICRRPAASDTCQSSRRSPVTNQRHETVSAPAESSLLRPGTRVIEGYFKCPVQRLHVSRPGLYQRLSTMSALLDVDVCDAESMASLYAAILIRDSQRQSNSETI